MRDLREKVANGGDPAKLHETPKPHEDPNNEQDSQVHVQYVIVIKALKHESTIGQQKIKATSFQYISVPTSRRVHHITILKTNTPYPSRKIRRIRACTHQRPQRKQDQYAVSREDQYAVLEIWNEYNILEDIKRGPYSKKSPIRPAICWLRNEPTGLIKIWEDLKTKFLNKYCPSGRTAKKIEEITNFQQEPDETLYQARERFKELLMKCSQYYLIEMQEVILFYSGLDVPTRQILDSRGAVPTKTAEDAKKAIQEMAEYSQKWHNGTSRGRSIETSDGLAAIQAQLNNLGKEIKTVNEKVYAAQVRYGGYRATTSGYYQRNNANPSYQERRQSMEDTLRKFMSESAKRHEENSNLIKKIRATIDAAIKNQGASIKTLEIQIGQMSKVLQERGFGSLPSLTKMNLRDQVKSISTTIEADSHSIRRIRSSQYAVSTGQNSKLLYKSRQMKIPFLSHLDYHYCKEEEGNYGPKFTKAYGASHINNAIPRKEKDLGSFTLPCFINNTCFDNALVDLGASVSIMPLSTYLNLGLGELAHTRLTVELADKTVKYPKGIAKNILVGIGKFTFPVDFIILDMLEDIKVPLILERPSLSTAHAKIDVYKIKITLRVGEEKIVFTSVDGCDRVRRICMLRAPL
ncbi:hypothetical protein Tco_0149888 [Tanacetum coccineum]